MTTDKKVNIRELALEVLLEAEKNDIFIKDALNRQLFALQFMSKQERAFWSRLVEGVTEYKIQLDYIVNCYSKTKINKCKPLIRVLLRMGVYQIFYMDSVPDGAAVNECVKLARKRGFANLSGFVNGVLRQIT
ncbi:MAG: 16S rRNA (cytosine(967)-C(5))-methyltransferase RsmB, partial [Lachnospiraceae bacterium]|nr:16S rRNA (cytosine(967)-C(5))-methyltransferase RsmB [Lachnospiraceae bacterium]